MQGLIAAGLITIILGGCASTAMQSVKYYPEGKKFTRILLFVPVRDLIIRRNIEVAVMREFNGKYKAARTGGTFGTPGIIEEGYVWHEADSLALTGDILYNCTDLIPLWDELTPEELDLYRFSRNWNIVEHTLVG